MYTTLDDPLATGSTLATHGTWANGISGDNIVGYYTDATGSHGFLYDGTSYTTLNDPLGTNGTWASGISGNNIVGYYTDATGSHGLLYNVPEPGTFTLLGSALLGLGLVYLRLKAKA